jgi:hypothetical protein
MLVSGEQRLDGEKPKNHHQSLHTNDSKYAKWAQKQLFKVGVEGMSDTARATAGCAGVHRRRGVTEMPLSASCRPQVP